MFVLWYSALSYKEYRDVIWDKLSSKKSSGSAANSKANDEVCPLSSKKTEPSRIPVIEPLKQQPPSPTPPKIIPQSPPKPPTPQAQIPRPIPPKSPSPQPPQKPLEAPAKPPRSPSPHPMRVDAFDDIEYDDEETEEEDEDSVIDIPPTPSKSFGNNVNDFLRQEIRSES